MLGCYHKFNFVLGCYRPEFGYCTARLILHIVQKSGGRRLVLSTRRSQNGYQLSSKSCTPVILFFLLIFHTFFYLFRPKSFLRVPANRPKPVGHALTQPFKVSGFSVAYSRKLHLYYTTYGSARYRTGR